MHGEDTQDRSSRLPHHALRVLGVVLLSLAGLGLWSSVTALLARFPSDPDTPYFRHAFYSMTAICMTCYVALLLVAVQFIRLRTTYFRMFVGIIIFEVVYFFAAALLAFVPGLGLSIAAANGVANGGLMFQFLILFPVWGPLLGRWATKTIDEPQPNDRSVYPEQEIARLSDWAWAAVNFVVLLAVAPFLIGVFWALYSPSTFPPFSFAWLLVLLSAANALLSVRYRRRRRRKKIERQREERRTRGLCPRCEYNLTGNVSGVCSECGEVIDG